MVKGIMKPFTAFKIIASEVKSLHLSMNKAKRPAELTCVNGGLEIWIAISFRASSAKSPSSVGRTMRSGEEGLSRFLQQTAQCESADFSVASGVGLLRVVSSGSIAVLFLALLLVTFSIVCAAFTSSVKLSPNNNSTAVKSDATFPGKFREGTINARLVLNRPKW